MWRWVRLAVRILVVLGLVAGFIIYLEPGAGTVESHYAQIVAGMTEAEVAAVLRAERDSRVLVNFYFGEGKSERRYASVWKFKEWGRPFFILVGFDRNGGVAWKRLIFGDFEKMGVWFYDFKMECYVGERPISVEVIKEGNE